MNIVYKIELEWHLGHPDSDQNFSEIISLFNKQDEDLARFYITETLRNANLIDDSHLVDISDGYKSTFLATITDDANPSYSSNIMVNVHLYPLLEKDGLFFELNQVYM